MASNRRIVALASTFRVLAEKEATLHPAMPPAERIEAAKIAAERAEALKEIFSIIAALGAWLKSPYGRAWRRTMSWMVARWMKARAASTMPS